MNVIKLVKKIAIEIPEQEAWWLVQKITSKNKSFLLLNRTIQLTSDQEITLFKWVNERINKKPLQYILGSVPFCNLDILVKPPILIPRPETEEWSSDLIKKLPNIPLNILDLCSGSGCITLALTKALPKARVIGLDIEQEAIDLALENKRHNDIHNVDFIKSDLYEAVHHKTFDLIFHSLFKHHLDVNEKELVDKVCINLSRNVFEYDGYKSWFHILLSHS